MAHAGLRTVRDRVVSILHAAPGRAPCERILHRQKYAEVVSRKSSVGPKAESKFEALRSEAESRKPEAGCSTPAVRHPPRVPVATAWLPESCRVPDPKKRP